MDKITISVDNDPEKSIQSACLVFDVDAISEKSPNNIIVFKNGIQMKKGDKIGFGNNYYIYDGDMGFVLEGDL